MVCAESVLEDEVYWTVLQVVVFPSKDKKMIVEKETVFC